MATSTGSAAAMEIHTPHEPPSTFREFRREYAMIVLSILTALGLERAAVYLHDRAAAQESRARIEQEIAGDLADLRKALAFNVANVDSTRAGLNALIDVLKSPSPDPAKVKQIAQDSMQGHLGLELPTWERDAWDAAIADQSASHLDPRDLRHYADLYTSARDAVGATNIVLGGAIFDRMADFSVDMQLDQVNGREAARIMARYLAAAQQIVAVQKDLLKSGENGETAPTK
jgi:hypothetical protein